MENILKELLGATPVDVPSEYTQSLFGDGIPLDVEFEVE